MKLIGQKQFITIFYHMQGYYWTKKRSINFQTPDLYSGHGTHSYFSFNSPTSPPIDNNWAVMFV